MDQEYNAALVTADAVALAMLSEQKKQSKPAWKNAFKNSLCCFEYICL